MSHSRSHTSGWLLAPAVALLLLVFVSPVVVNLGRSADGGIEQLREVMSPSFVRILVRTALTAAAVALISMVVAYPVAYLAATTTRRRAQLILGVVGMSLFVSIVVRGYAWMAILDRQGVVNTMLGTDLELLHNQFAVLVGLVQYGIPLMVYPLYGSMRQVDWRLVRAARSLGATGVRAFWGVYVPQTINGIIAGLTVVYVVVLGYYILPAILGGPRSTMIGEYIATQYLTTADFERGAAAATVLLVTSLVMFTLIRGAGQLLVRGPRR